MNLQNQLEQLNKSTSQGGSRTYYAGKEIQSVLGITDLFEDSFTGKYSMMPRGLMAAICLQLTPAEMRILLIVMEETYSSGFTRWYFSTAKLAKWAQFLDIENIKSRGDTSNALKSLQNAGIIHYEVNQRTASYVEIHRGTFIVDNYEKVYVKRKVRKVNKTARENGFSTQKALLTLEGNSYANHTSLFDFSYSDVYGEEDTVTAKGTQSITTQESSLHNRSQLKSRVCTIDHNSNQQTPSTPSTEDTLRGNRGNRGMTDAEILSDLKEIASCNITDVETKERAKVYGAEFKFLVDQLQRKVPYRSKVKWSTAGEECFAEIAGKDAIVENYILHQEKEKKFAKTFENFLLDYEAIVNDIENGSGTEKKENRSEAVF